MTTDRTNHTRYLHEERMRPHYPRIESDEELAAAYRSLQLHWLREYPEYREEIRKRVSEAAKKAETRLNYYYTRDFDLMGRDIDGCG